MFGSLALALAIHAFAQDTTLPITPDGRPPFQRLQANVAKV